MLQGHLKALLYYFAADTQYTYHWFEKNFRLVTNNNKHSSLSTLYHFQITTILITRILQQIKSNWLAHIIAGTYVPCTLFWSSATNRVSISQATTCPERFFYKEIKPYRMVMVVNTKSAIMKLLCWHTFFACSKSLTVMLPVPGPTSNTVSVGRRAA